MQRTVATFACVKNGHIAAIQAARVHVRSLHPSSAVYGWSQIGVSPDYTLIHKTLTNPVIICCLMSAQVGSQSPYLHAGHPFPAWCKSWKMCIWLQIDCTPHFDASKLVQFLLISPSARKTAFAVSCACLLSLQFLLGRLDGLAEAAYKQLDAPGATLQSLKPTGEGKPEYLVASRRALTNALVHACHFLCCKVGDVLMCSSKPVEQFCCCCYCCCCCCCCCCCQVS